MTHQSSFFYETIRFGFSDPYQPIPLEWKSYTINTFEILFPQSSIFLSWLWFLISSGSVRFDWYILFYVIYCIYWDACVYLFTCVYIGTSSLLLANTWINLFYRFFQKNIHKEIGATLYATSFVWWPYLEEQIPSTWSLIMEIVSVEKYKNKDLRWDFYS